jgi:tetratricopeptide (TPR) repeat protein
MTQAARCLAGAITLAERTGDVQALRNAHGLLAELDLLDERGESSGAAALAHLQPFVDGAASDEEDVTALLPVLAWSYLELGDVEKARAIAVRAATDARAQRNCLHQLDALRIQGMAAARQIRWDAAAQTFDQALALARGMPYPYAEGRLLYEYGRMRAEQGDVGQARTLLADAHAIFLRLGANLYRERTEQQLSLHLSAQAYN